MEALITTLIATALAEMGDRTQLLCAILALRFHRSPGVFAGFFLAALFNTALSAFGGELLSHYMTRAPLLLFQGLALMLAGGAMLIPVRKIDRLERWKSGAFVTSFLGIFIVEFGDKSQFLVIANAARTGSPVWTFIGGMIGLTIATIPAFIFGETIIRMAAVRTVRIAGGILFLLVGIWAGLSAVGLI